MSDERSVQVSVPLPGKYAFTARLRPGTVRQTALRLAPWALYFVIPRGRFRMLSLMTASRLSPIARPRRYKTD